MTGLGGCASVMEAAHSATSWTGRQAKAGWQEVVAALRPAPEAPAAFASYDTGDADLNLALMERKLSEPEPVRVAIDRRMDNGVLVVRPGRQRVRVQERLPHLRGPMPVRAQPVAEPEPQPTTPVQPSETPGQAFDYVRLDGPSDMVDWRSCEAQVGGAFLATAAGMALAPDFDACMRAKGYVLEAEARARLDAQY